MQDSGYIDKLITDTVYSDANMVFSKMIVLNDMNTDKFEMLKNLTTTELISNLDLLTLYEIAREMSLPVQLPNQAIRGSHVMIDYKWGTIVLLANMTEN